MDQLERLDYLVEKFKEDSVRYRDIETPGDTEGKKRLLRSLMNIRMPKDISPDVLKVQDEYLKEGNRENGVVDIVEIPSVSEQGSVHVFSDRIYIWQGDITRLSVDAIVNAANSEMLGCFVPMHTCIDNCIHTFAGIELRSECSRQMKLLRQKYGQDYVQPTAVPMLTPGYNLPAKHVIHIVGPIVQYGLTDDLEKDLADCYLNTLDLCKESSFESVAFCCISTGVFSFPGKRAAEIAVKSVSDWMYRHSESRIKVIFNVFKNEDKKYYEQQLF